MNTRALNLKKYGRYIDDCISATFSTRDELTQLTTTINSFRPALKYTWEISDTSLAFLHIKISIEGNGLCISVCLLQTFRFTYLLVVFILACVTRQEFHFFLQFLRLCRLCSDESDSSHKSEAMCQFFVKRGFEIEEDWDEGTFCCLIHAR